MKTIVYIIGAGHSGSTLLSLLLGGHDKIISLGELTDTFKKGSLDDAARERVCSCGEYLDDCPFWGEVKTRVGNSQISDLDDFYARVTDIFAAVYGFKTIPVDSSKKLKTLRFLEENNRFDIKTIFLTKDVRNYAISRIDQVGGLAISHFLNWYKRNKKTLDELQNRAIPYFRIGYEELCFSPEAILSRLCDFLDLEMPYSMLKSNTGRHHILWGNSIRKDETKKQAIQYDSRWLQRREWQLPSLLLPPVMRLNSGLVYSNQTDRIWRRR